MASPQEIFTELGRKYDWDEKVISWMTHADGLAAKNLDAFMYATTTEAEVAGIVEAIGVTNKFAQTSRIRQAWLALRKGKEEEASLKRKVADENDLDVLLPQPNLDSIADIFWDRYKIAYTPDVEPSDLLISRIVKEIEKRLLSLRDVWKVKTQAHFLKSQSKRTKVAECIEIVQPDALDDEVPNSDLPTYLCVLFTLLLAYARAGAAPLPGAPEREPRGSDTTLFVGCPFDVLEKYYHRAVVQSAKVKPSLALEWLSSKDEQERTIWVDKFRNGQDALGKVISTVFERREAMWEVSRDMLKGAGPDKPGKGPPVPPAPPGKGADRGGGSSSGGAGMPAKLADQLRDGSLICRKYNRGEKCGPECQMKHVCAAVCRNGRVCGARHPASQCNNKKVPRKQ